MLTHGKAKIEKKENGNVSSLLKKSSNSARVQKDGDPLKESCDAFKNGLDEAKVKFNSV